MVIQSISIDISAYYSRGKGRYKPCSSLLAALFLRAKLLFARVYPTVTDSETHSFTNVLLYAFSVRHSLSQTVTDVTSFTF